MLKAAPGFSSRWRLNEPGDDHDVTRHQGPLGPWLRPLIEDHHRRAIATPTGRLRFRPGKRPSRTGWRREGPPTSPLGSVARIPHKSRRFYRPACAGHARPCGAGRSHSDRSRAPSRTRKPSTRLRRWPARGFARRKSPTGAPLPLLLVLLEQGDDPIALLLEGGAESLDRGRRQFACHGKQVGGRQFSTAAKLTRCPDVTRPGGCGAGGTIRLVTPPTSPFRKRDAHVDLPDLGAAASSNSGTASTPFAESVEMRPPETEYVFYDGPPVPHR